MVDFWKSLHPQHSPHSRHPQYLAICLRLKFSVCRRTTDGVGGARSDFKNNQSQRLQRVSLQNFASIVPATGWGPTFLANAMTL